MSGLQLFAPNAVRAVVDRGWGVRPLKFVFRRGRELGKGSEMLLSVYRDHGVVPKDSRDDNHNRASDDLSKYQFVRRGDLVVNKMKAWQGSVAVSSYDGIVSPAYFVYRPLAGIESRYAHYLLRTRDYFSFYAAISAGVRPGQWDLDPVAFDRMSVLLPPMREQQQIADYLDHETDEIDAFIVDLAASISLVQERMSSELESLIWAPESDGIQLRRYVQEVDQGVSPIADNGPAGPGETGVLKAGCTNDGRFAVESNKRLLSDEDVPASAFISPGDLIVTRASGSVRHVGSAAIVPLLDRRLSMSDKHYRLRPSDRASAEFIQLAMQTRRFRADLEPRISGAAGLAKNISIAQLLSARVPHIDLAAQLAIGVEARVEVAALSEALADINAAIALAKERRAALITDVVTGRIDVSTKHPPAVDSIQTAIEESR